MAARDPVQRKINARIAILTRWSREDGRAAAAQAQAGLMRRFEREVDPDGELTPEERHRRAESARRAHMLRLSAKSAKVRRERKAAAG